MNESSYSQNKTLTWANLFLRHFLQAFLETKVKPGEVLLPRRRGNDLLRRQKRKRSIPSLGTFSTSVWNHRMKTTVNHNFYGMPKRGCSSYQTSHRPHPLLSRHKYALHEYRMCQPLLKAVMKGKKLYDTPIMIRLTFHWNLILLIASNRKLNTMLR